MHKRILQLAIPNIISNITIPLVGITDLALLGHFSSAEHIGAVALASIIFSIIYWSFSFLRMGTSGFAAQNYGQRNFHEASLLLFRGFAVSVTAGVLLIILQIPIANLAFLLLDGSSHVKALAMDYYKIRIFAAPASLSLYVFYGWYIGLQNARSPMIIALSINLINVLFNTLFVYVFNMGAEGVAWGTVIAQYSGLSIALLILVRYYRSVFKRVQAKQILVWHQLQRFFTVNSHIFFRTLLVVGVLSFFTNSSAATDTTTLAVNTLLLQFMYLFSFFADGFAYAAEALAGKYIGAQNPKQLRILIRQLFVWGTGIGIATTLLYAILGPHLMQLFTSETQLIASAKPYLWFVVLLPIAAFASYIWDGIFIGATDSKYLLITIVIATLVFFASYYSLRYYQFGNSALWIALILFNISRGVFQTLLAPKLLRKWIPQQA